MKSRLLRAVCVPLIMFVSLSAHAVGVSGQGTWETTLQGRDLDGDPTTFEAYYDTLLNITWLDDTAPIGYVNWNTTDTWVTNLNVNGITGWRLPIVRPINGVAFQYVPWSYNGTTDRGQNISAPGTLYAGSIASEFAHMNYNTLGNKSRCDAVASTAKDCALIGFATINTGPFSNIKPGLYWTGTIYGSAATKFDFWLGWGGGAGGAQDFGFLDGVRQTWAVRDGDVGLTDRIPVVSASANRDDGNVAENTIDDDLGTRWSCENDGEPDCYIVFDLGSVQSVTRVAIAFFRGDERMALFGLEASLNGTDWTQVWPNGTSSSGTTLQPEPFSVGMQAQYLRYTGQGNTANNWVSVTEFHVYGKPVSPPPDRIPVVSASANRDDGNVAENTIDDDLGTRWSCENDGEPDCYIVFDLGSVQSVTRVAIAFFRGDERMALFGLEASLNGTDWTQVWPNGTSSSGTTLQPEPFSVGMQAQYLRYTGQGNTANNWVSVTEFHVLGGGSA